MRKLILISILILSLASARGQYVLIPDSNFRHALISQGFASCFDSTQTMLDTTCSAVLDSTVINVANLNIRSIEGIEYFKMLKSLTCSNNPLYALPVLPNTTSYLTCEYDSLTALPVLPTSLYLLLGFHNQLDSLPLLPNGLRWLEISGNNISALPSLPASVYGLFCGGNQIVNFPQLPANLYNLDCSGNPIAEFPLLPASLRILYCNTTNRDTLPVLPDSLQKLECSYNHLRYLPTLPNTLHVLTCSYNQLTSLPTLPDSLVSLDCSSNQLTSIPALPDSMFMFSCGANSQLTCLPFLKRIVNFNFSGTAITCLPDTGNITHSSPLLSSLPLCGANGCNATGLNDPVMDNMILRAFPNPSNGTFTVDMIGYDEGETDIHIYDALGRSVYQSTSINKAISIDTRLVSGLYTIEAVQGDKKQFARIVIE